MIVKPKFPECKTCINFNPRRLNPICLSCDAGEHYDPKVDFLDPNEDDFFQTLTEMTYDEENE